MVDNEIQEVKTPEERLEEAKKELERLRGVLKNSISVGGFQNYPETLKTVAGQILDKKKEIRELEEQLKNTQQLIPKYDGNNFFIRMLIKFANVLQSGVNKLDEMEESWYKKRMQWYKEKVEKEIGHITKTEDEELLAIVNGTDSRFSLPPMPRTPHQEMEARLSNDGALKGIGDNLPAIEEAVVAGDNGITQEQDTEEGLQL